VPSGIAVPAATMKQGGEANSVAATPGAIGRPRCGGGQAINARGRRWARDVVSRQHMHALREVCCINIPHGATCAPISRGARLRPQSWGSDGPPIVAQLSSEAGAPQRYSTGQIASPGKKALDERPRARILLGSKTSIVPALGRAAQTPGASRPVYLSLTLIPLRNTENHVSLS
jgi:hypothetical protein